MALRRVALLIETSKAFGRGVLAGVTRYVRAHQSWVVEVDERGLADPTPRNLRNWRGQGIIVRSQRPQLVEAAIRTGANVVHLGEAMHEHLPMIVSDDHGIGACAAEHLLSRGFRQFGYVGLPDTSWSTRRKETFTTCIQRAGHACQTHRLAASSNASDRRLTAWLNALPKPAGVLACHDVTGLRVLNACRRSGIAVPEELAVLGVDDDALLCELGAPPMSSVAHNLDHIGFQAAALLDQLMQGQTINPRIQTIAPLGVVVRQSTELTAIHDSEVAQAVQWIRDHACQSVRIADLLDEIPLSRSMLARRFRRALGRSPKDEMLRVQLAHAKRLLADTDYTLSHIANLSGFQYAAHLSVLFKKKVGLTPGQYRKQKSR